jgi:hypothetical protein
VTWDLTVAGTSVKNYAHVVSYDGVLSGAPRRGDDIVKPSVTGQTFVAKPRDAYTFSVPLILLGSTQADFQDKLSSLRALCDSVTAIAVTRTVPTGAGDLSTTCTAAANITEVGMTNGLLNGRVVLEVTNYDGCWYAPITSPTVPGTVSVTGNERTNKITLVLPGAGTLTNTTLGVAVAVTAGQTLACLPRTTNGSLSQISASGDPLGNWFALAPGSNTITWSAGGTPTLSYQPAYQ